jgi:GNAT superfamily N-acetyltransferase
MQIRPIDVASDEETARFHQILTAAEAFERPHAQLESVLELRVDLRKDDPGERTEAFGAFDGGEMVGAAMTYLPLLDNTDLMWFMAFVEPERRRAGIGSQLAGHCVARASELGRHTLMSDAFYPVADRETHPYRRFAESHGFALASTEIVRELGLPVDTSLLAELAGECAPHHTAYALSTFASGLPDELLPSYCAAQNRLAVDAPSGDFDFEEEKATPDLVSQRFAREREMGRRRLTTVATHPDVGVVAYTDLILDDRDQLHQWGTLVIGPHRGHRLGTAVKVRNLQQFQERFPGSYRAQTGNSEVNGHMVSINERLGFRAIELCAEFKRVLTSRG